MPSGVDCRCGWWEYRRRKEKFAFDAERNRELDLEAESLKWRTEKEHGKDADQYGG